MSAAQTHYDLLIIGGGIAGATLGRAMALTGAQVLIVEKEVEFRDRVRGEVLLPWGSVEAKELGIYDVLLGSCAREAPREYFYIAGEPSPPRDFLTSTPKSTCVLSFYHPEMQEALLTEAASVGAAVWRGATLRAVTSDAKPQVKIEVGGETRQMSAKLVVGADGRESQLAGWLSFDRVKDPLELFTGGLQLTGEMPIEQALYFFLHGRSGRGSIIVRNRANGYRIYLLHHKDALPRRLSGQRDYATVLDHFREIGIPRGWFEGVRPSGLFATFDGAHRWIDQPVRGGVVLIGDAAAVSDPVWGNGLSKSLRDVRLLRDRLLNDRDWPRAAMAYAGDHIEFFQRLRRAERLNATLLFSMGDAAEERRVRAFTLMAKHPELNLDVPGLGPEARYSEYLEKTLLGRGS
jgi:2-polyprenyl-6-methoxyphenol hydroxylase-like FAD-dependent oxidoreductase